MARQQSCFPPPNSYVEKAEEYLRVRQRDLQYELPSVVPRRGSPSFYESFSLRGLKLQMIEPGHVLCTLKVPSRLTDASGMLIAGAIANIVDDIGAAAVASDGQPMKVSVDINISYTSTAKINDDIEIDARVLGHKGGFSMAQVDLRNKTTGELVAQGRHSLYSSRASKL